MASLLRLWWWLTRIRERDRPRTYVPRQNVLSRTSEIKRDVEEAIKQGDVEPLLTPGLQAVVSCLR